MRKIVIATANSHKFGEIERILEPDKLGIELVFGGALAANAPDETGDSFYENALLKAKYYSQIAKLPAIADDSGLIVNILGDEPGLYSARYAGNNCTYEDNNRKLLEKMRNIPHEKRNAYFICITVLYLLNGSTFATEGILNGRISNASEGTGGFGYDPIFELFDGRTVAQIPEDEKNKISHRAKAFRIMRFFLNK
ncbi:RdgB/HAM1 family non-canonical purine NTP pyrophosphatase [bacterium]|nr:RdgB/HAM1 family non-canonical purine NTP pyrophosphatase [bacterium]